MSNKLSIVLAGEAGQGIQSVESLLVNLFKKSGYHIFATKEYMSRIRGGVNSTTIIISDEPIIGWYEKIDIFVPFSLEAIQRLKSRINNDTKVIIDKSQINYENSENVIDIPLQKISEEIGSPLFSNTIIAGFFAALLDTDIEILKSILIDLFIKKGQDIVDKNIIAAMRGFEIGNNYRNLIKINIKKDEKIQEHLLLNGADAISIGALAGGCNACFAYPMTPSTSVFTNMATYSKKYDIAVEQVEDEIGVINMALGCWYAGGRALVSTSGGGFALMTEGLSLSGMTETPVVIHLAQRPGPATGLPTRTEQGDLNLALYAGHGTFPRIILAPGNLKQAFELTALAFNLADKYQVPVFIMSDQYFIDTYYNIAELPVNDVKVEYYIIKTTKDYKRYKITDDGISPRGIPAYGDGLVAVDSDEHDEDGRITEDLDGISLQMKNKRLRKFEKIKESCIEPVLYGDEDYRILLVGWGSTHNIILEALKEIKNREIAFLFFPQVFPLHSKTAKYLNKAQKVIIIENNATGQFADLIKSQTGFEIKEKILKYNGLQFSVEELINKIQEKI
ncbi:MAG: 2-oxoacid:acceptor oxidoreductase subunit alpha [Candidatus Goldbacteria bacterium]|nr:2-oxoacid:acceptor oxidoreductase subunit alpha [Candidatus Goldiibacteriota bacterium]